MGLGWPAVAWQKWGCSKGVELPKNHGICIIGWPDHALVVGIGIGFKMMRCALRFRHVLAFAAGLLASPGAASSMGASGTLITCRAKATSGSCAR